MLNLIKEQDNDSLIDKISLYAKDLNRIKYKFLIKKREDIKHLNDSKAFIECSQCIDHVCNNTDNCNLSRKIKILIVFDEMIADIMSNKKFQVMVKELFIKCRKLNISLVFITQYFFCFVLKEVRSNSTHYSTVKIHKKRGLQNIATNHSANIDYKDFMNICKKFTSKRYSILNFDTTLPASNLLRFRKSLLLPYKNDTN